MPGLLDITDDPNQLGLLSLGLRLMSTPGKFGAAIGQAGMGALGDVQQARQMMEQRKLREQQARMQGLQMQSLEQQLADAQRAREEAAALRQTRGSFLDSIDPTAGPAMPPTLVGAMRAGFSPQEAQTFLPPKPEAFTLKPGERRYEGDKVVAEIPAEPPKGTRLAELIRERDALPPGHPLRATYDNAIRKETTHQPATSVTVQPDNLGLKPKDKFEMEQKLAADFSAATKNDRAIISTAQDISGILQQGGALKDQAAIYKFAKALDPDGAVREADYAAIVRTAGGLDYVKALVNKALTGEQLSTNQRTEMARLMQSMAAVAQGRIDKAKTRFGSNATLYNLNPDNVFQGGVDSAPSLQDLAAAELARRQGRK